MSVALCASSRTVAAVAAEAHAEPDRLSANTMARRASTVGSIVNESVATTVVSAAPPCAITSADATSSIVELGAIREHAAIRTGRRQVYDRGSSHDRSATTST